MVGSRWGLLQSRHKLFFFFFFLLLQLLILVLVMQLSLIDAANPNSTAISRFQKYLTINTAQPIPKYDVAVNYILSEFRHLGLEAQTLELVASKPILLLKWPGSDPDLQSILLNSHMDVVPVEETKWAYPPFGGEMDSEGNIYGRGSQDMKCVGMQYLEAIQHLKSVGFQPTRSVYVSFVPDEEIGGHDGAAKFSNSDVFKKMNVAIVLDEGVASPNDNYNIFYAERSPWWLVIKATGSPGHGARLYDHTAIGNLLMSIESISRFRDAQFDMVKAGLKAEGDVISVNTVFLKAGTPSPDGFIMNLQPSEAEAGFDIRVPPSADPRSLEWRIEEEWAPASRNMTFEFKQKVDVRDEHGMPISTKTDSSNPWWSLLEEAVRKADRKLATAAVFPASTDARYFRAQGIPVIGFSPISNTPVLLHNHNEFLNEGEYLKGIEVYSSIIQAYTSFMGDTSHRKHRDEL